MYRVRGKNMRLGKSLRRMLAEEPEHGGADCVYFGGDV